MTDEKIEAIANFMFSSDSSVDVPFRICITINQFAGFDLSRDGLSALLIFLRDNEPDARNFKKFYDRAQENEWLL